MRLYLMGLRQLRYHDSLGGRLFTRGLYTPPPNPSGLRSDTWTVLGLCSDFAQTLLGLCSDFFG